MSYRGVSAEGGGAGIGKRLDKFFGGLGSGASTGKDVMKCLGVGCGNRVLDQITRNVDVSKKPRPVAHPAILHSQ